MRFFNVTGVCRLRFMVKMGRKCEAVYGSAVRQNTNSALLLSARSGINDGACPGVGYQTGTLTLLER